MIIVIIVLYKDDHETVEICLCRTLACKCTSVELNKHDFILPPKDSL